MGIRQEKEKIVQQIKADLESAKVIVLTDYRGLTVAQMNDLRNILREEGIKYKVVKNTLTRFAAREAGFNELEKYMEGPIAIAYGYDDPVVPLRVLVKFAKKNEALTLKGGVLEKMVLDEKNLRVLSDLPPREVLLSTVLGSFQSPISGLLNVMQGNLRNLAYVLQAVKEKKDDAA